MIRDSIFFYIHNSCSFQKKKKNTDTENIYHILKCPRYNTILLVEELNSCGIKKLHSKGG